MTTLTREEMLNATGATSSVRPLKLKSIRLNGNTGEVVIVNTDKDLGPSESYESTPVTTPFGCVFLKSRRKLVESDQNGIVMSTTEHDDKDDHVLLFSNGKKVDEGKASDLREKYQGLRTWQILYVRYKGEICRLTVKGLSLSNAENKAGYYEHLNSFDREKNEAMFDYMTKISVVQPVIDGEQKKFYAFHYERGEELTAEQKEQVVENFATVHKNAEDTKVKEPVTAQSSTPVVELSNPNIGDTGIPYPQEEIKDEDIPF